MIQIAEMLGSQPSSLWRLVQQAGVRHAVAGLPFREGSGQQPWEFMPLMRMKTRFEDAGFQVSVIESSPPMNKIRLGLQGRDEEIEQFQTLIQNMGALGIPVICYNFMAVMGWLRTSTAVPDRGGALVTGYDHELMRHAPLTEAGVLPEERLWENMAYFLERVVPVAEAAKVKLALHPDDPPLSPIRGVGRIVRSLEAFQRVIDLVPSEYNGITMCQGNFALMTNDLPGAIRHFGRQNRIHFVHFRDVRGTPERFLEKFHDDGQTNMLACMRAYREIGFDGVLRPDHVPTMEGDTNERPGYSSVGRLFAIGYIKGLREAVYESR